ncbi:hypothetical protein [Nocardioides yefusunii]|uniref:Uncharacterized protein n=1 Tax=Nocardioides yefusunii TaxID=2500546 RepID=A0ABW1QVC1_9ACTN|nr:hypothetical protein [Nocardioides yefusunii]
MDLPAPPLRQSPAVALPRALESALRREGLKVKDERTRGHVPLRVWAGTIGAQTPPATGAGPGTDLSTWIPAPRTASDASLFCPGPEEVMDAHDRFEVSLALGRAVIGHVSDPWFWLTRSGTPDPCPADLEWISSAHRAWKVLGLAPRAAVVTREGWWLHPSGARRTWKRLRH